MDNSVIDSRLYNGKIRRRRECRECGVRFSTLEIEVTEVQAIENVFDRIDRLDTSLDEILLMQ